MRKHVALLVLLGFSMPAIAVGPKMSASGGIGSAASTYATPGGELTGGSYSINGTTGVPTFGGVPVLPAQSANMIFAAPSSGSGVPSFRSLVSSDLPVGTGSVTSVGIAPPSIFTAGSAVTTSGNLSFTLNGQTSGTVFAGPTSGTGIPAFRALATGDIPTTLPTLTGLTTSGAINSGSNIFLTDVSQSTGFIYRPSTAGYRNLEVSSTSGALDQFIVNSLQSTFSGGLAVPNYYSASFGPTGLLTPVVANTETATKFQVRHPVGGIAILASTQTSDSANTGGDSTVAFEGYAFNNNVTNVQNAHAVYIEGRSYGSVGTVGPMLGIESAVTRDGSNAPTLTPYTMVQNNMAVSYWGTSGRDDIANSHNASAFAGVYKGSSTGASVYYNSGIVFDYQSLDPTGPMSAIHMPLSYNIRYSDASHDGLAINGNLFQANEWNASVGYTVNLIRARASGTDTSIGDNLGSLNFYGTQGGTSILRATFTSVIGSTGRGSLNLSSTNDSGTLDTVALNYNGNHVFGPSSANMISLGMSSLPWSATYSQILKLTPVSATTLGTCSSANEGTLGAITDGNSAIFNAPIASGGSNHVMAYCNGTNWTVH